MLNENLSIMRYPEDYATGIIYNTVNVYTYGHIGWQDTDGDGLPDIYNTVNVYTYGHIGWQDTDGDGLPDPIDTTPDVTLDLYLPDPTTDRTPTYTGSAQDIPVHTTHPDYVDVTINDVTVEYRVDGGPWHPAVPTDGSFDSFYEEFTFAPLLCQNATYLVEAHAVNSVGHASPIASDTLTVSSPTPCRMVYLPTVMRNYGTGGRASTPESAPTSPAVPRLFASPLQIPEPVLPIPGRFDSPLPTPTPVSTPTPADDAPNSMAEVIQTSPKSVRIERYIAPSGDEDWFRFDLTAVSDVDVQLSSLPADYDLYLYNATGRLIGFSVHNGRRRERITLDRLSIGYYYVQVVGYAEAWDETAPYRLRFKAAVP
jgi:hypothetical protein